MTTLKKPLTRRIGRLVVRITPDGCAIRGFRKKKWRAVSWQRLASLVADAEPLPICEASEAAIGRRVLESIGALEAEEAA